MKRGKDVLLHLSSAIRSSIPAFHAPQITFSQFPVVRAAWLSKTPALMNSTDWLLSTKKEKEKEEAENRSVEGTPSSIPVRSN